MNNYWLSAGAVACLLGLAVRYDIATRRIPNWLVASGLVVGLAFSLFAPQPAFFSTSVGLGLSQSLLGALVGLALMLPLYAIRAMGGGDVKLMAAIGAFLGPMPVVGAVLLTFVAGGVLSLLAALFSGALARVIDNLRLMGLVVFTARSSGLSLRDVQTTGRLPYAVAIAIGTGLQIGLTMLKDWPFK
ncbi:A24 family peptidase [Propionivibrio limicola]|uniref:A24 family peptidase n=1 Tax=Propionivibrio limicola TaxID=167645 RepID=UPI001290C209|nr:A24 family peptidase [Propionivibrio limicola]